MKYGYRSEEDRMVRNFWDNGKIGEMVANFMTDYYQPLMKRKSIKNEEIEMLNHFKAMAEELLEHLENNVERK